MIIDRDNLEELSTESWPTIPKEESAVVKRYKAGKLDISFHQGPELGGDDVVIYTPFAMSVKMDGKYVFAVSIEQNDLRAMAPLMKAPVKELQEEFGVKGFYTEPHIVLYAGEEKEEQGIYTLPLNARAASEFLLNLTLDMFDEIEEVEEIK